MGAPSCISIDKLSRKRSWSRDTLPVAADNIFWASEGKWKHWGLRYQFMYSPVICCLLLKPWPIEIDGLPNLKWLFSIVFLYVYQSVYNLRRNDPHPTWGALKFSRASSEYKSKETRKTLIFSQPILTHRPIPDSPSVLQGGWGVGEGK